MSAEHPRVAVVVVTYNSEPLLLELLGSLANGLAGLSWELVVADNDSSDSGTDLVRRCCPEATVVEMGRNAGYAAGINAAVAAAGTHDAILVLNPDVRLGPGCALELLEALAEPGVGIAVPQLVDAHGRLITSMRREPTVRRAMADALVGGERAGRFPRLGEVVTDRGLYDHPQLTDWAEGSTQLISHECWRCSGPWDESYFLYSEETDFGLRARDAGFATRYVPTARAVHLEGGSGTSPAQGALLMVNRVRLFRRRNGVVRSSVFWAATLLRESIRAAFGRASSKAAARALVSPRSFREAPGPHLLSGR